ncbi:hypothetical protein O181_088605, partial [Austropuccinia psidii MF-1]|nr:hypothetical protein [Austropuccinia psidii MF-1]
MPTTIQMQRKKVYAIEKVPEVESPTADSESDSVGDAIREHSDDDQDPREEFLVEYQEETPLEIQDIQLEAVGHTSHSGQKLSGQPLPNWEEQPLPTKSKNFKSASGKMTSIGTIIQEIIIPHGKGLLLGTDYQRMYGMDIYNSKNRDIIIGTNKEKQFSLYILQISAQVPLEELLNEFIEGPFSTTLT